MSCEIRKNIWGHEVVAYECEGCGDRLTSPIEDAGSNQVCPTCHQTFVCPGVAEIAAHKKKEEEFEALRVASIASAAVKAIEAKARKDSEPLVVKVKVAKPQKPPDLVWRGRMYCSDCGYRWQARRNTPPARCPSCSRRSAVVVREARGLGCLIFLATLLPFTGAAAWGIHHLMWTVFRKA